MSREIKFRAWDSIAKEMYLPFELADGLNDCAESHHAYGKNPDHYIYLQFTGLKDKNGKEIWEGDVVRCYTKSLSEVVYDHEVKLPEFYREIWSSKIVGEDKMWLPADEGENCGGIEVIGNIYESPELLKHE